MTKQSPFVVDPLEPAKEGDSSWRTEVQWYLQIMPGDPLLEGTVVLHGLGPFLGQENGVNALPFAAKLLVSMLAATQQSNGPMIGLSFSFPISYTVQMPSRP